MPCPQPEQAGFVAAQPPPGAVLTASQLSDTLILIKTF
jgi:hypothetical protein